MLGVLVGFADGTIMGVTDMYLVDQEIVPSQLRHHNVLVEEVYTELEPEVSIVLVVVVVQLLLVRVHLQEHQVLVVQDHQLVLLEPM